MAKLDVYNMEGAVVGEIELSDTIFGLEEPNEAVMHQVVKAILANKRQGTAATRTRSERRGGGRKPYRQKGTGRARQGSIRSPQWVGGGVVFGPHPRSYRQSVNKKMRRLAMKSAFTTKARDGKIVVVDNFDLPEIKTKAFVNALNSLPVEGSALLVEAAANDNLYLSARNVPQVDFSRVETLNVYDILKYDNLVLTESAVAKIQEVYA
ncbi:MAG: 50S ribosomal protein L4 [Fastidiosipilaceae bacterium]|jgi:large subunit ribosomal protein L4|nr:50S ribosomal protein L4 [Clostridiaceae bacterium]